MVNFRKIEKKDLEFINRVRNGYAKDFLHDSRTFTLEQTHEWFKNNPTYYMIEIQNETVGYIRMSNIESESLYMGIDIAPEFCGKGIATEAYETFFAHLLWTSNIKTVYLEVLPTNFRAIRLYNKLGFKKIYENQYTIKMAKEL